MKISGASKCCEANRFLFSDDASVVEDTTRKTKPKRLEDERVQVHGFYRLGGAGRDAV